MGYSSEMRRLAYLLSCFLFACASGGGFSDAGREDANLDQGRDTSLPEQGPNRNCQPGDVRATRMNDGGFGCTLGQVEEKETCRADGSGYEWIQGVGDGSRKLCTPGETMTETINTACGSYDEMRVCSSGCMFGDPTGTPPECACTPGQQGMSRQITGGEGCAAGTKTQIETCRADGSGYDWTDQGDFDGSSAACVAGATEERTLSGSCGSYMQTRTCSPSCVWGAYVGEEQCVGDDQYIGRACTIGNTGGSCSYVTSSCSGDHFPGACPGSAAVQCCIEDADTCMIDGAHFAEGRTFTYQICLRSGANQGKRPVVTCLMGEAPSGEGVTETAYEDAPGSCASGSQRYCDGQIRQSGIPDAIRRCDNGTWGPI